MGLYFLAFWPFRGPLLGPTPQVAKNACLPNVLQWIYQRRDRLHFAVFSILRLHFLAFWPCGPSFPCILALWAFSSLHFGLVGLHFLAFWPCGPAFPFILAFSGSASGPPPPSCQKWPVCQTSLQWIYQRRDRLHFAVGSLLGVHFLAFWPCRHSFPCILALWAFISLHFGLVGFHFLAFCPFWPCLPFILAFLAFISFHFCLLVASFWGPPHKLPKTVRFPKVPHKEFNSARPSSIFRFLAFLALFSFHFGFFGLVFHFGLLGIHFLSFWPFWFCFPFILAFWAVNSFHSCLLVAWPKLAREVSRGLGGSTSYSMMA